jgi:hypothetical protein
MLRKSMMKTQFFAFSALSEISGAKRNAKRTLSAYALPLFSSFLSGYYCFPIRTLPVARQY